MIQRILCWFGIHRWYEGTTTSLVTYMEWRRCERCGEHQITHWEEIYPS